MEDLKQFISNKNMILLITECDYLIRSEKTRKIFCNFLKDLLDKKDSLRVVLIVHNGETIDSHEYNKVINICTDKSNIESSTAIKVLKKYDKENKTKHLINKRTLCIQNYQGALPNHDFNKYFTPCNISIQSVSFINQNALLTFATVEQAIIA